ADGGRGWMDTPGGRTVTQPSVAVTRCTVLFEDRTPVRDAQDLRGQFKRTLATQGGGETRVNGAQFRGRHLRAHRRNQRIEHRADRRRAVTPQPRRDILGISEKAYRLLVFLLGDQPAVCINALRVLLDSDADDARQSPGGTLLRTQAPRPGDEKRRCERVAEDDSPVHSD